MHFYLYFSSLIAFIMVVTHASIPVCDSVYTFPETAEFVVREFILLYIHQTYPELEEVYNLSVAYHFGYNSVSFTFDTVKLTHQQEAIKIPVFTKQKNVIKYESCITKPYPVYAEIGKHGYSDIGFNAATASITTASTNQQNVKRRKTTK